MANGECRAHTELKPTTGRGKRNYINHACINAARDAAADLTLAQAIGLLQSLKHCKTIMESLIACR